MSSKNVIYTICVESFHLRNVLCVILSLWCYIHNIRYCYTIVYYIRLIFAYHIVSFSIVLFGILSKENIIILHQSVSCFSTTYILSCHIVPFQRCSKVCLYTASPWIICIYIYIVMCIFKTMYIYMYIYIALYYIVKWYIRSCILLYHIILCYVKLCIPCWITLYYVLLY